MGARWLVGVAGMVVAATLAACSATTDEAVGGDRASVRQAEFDKNSVLTDTALRDTTALSAADIQAFLEKTPWGQTSVLATYEEDGKSAAEIMHDAATKHGINPLELLVRVQMEQGLINKATASEESISIAFGCGCPHSPVCSSKYEGFANQADCAAGTLSRSMDCALTSNGTASGWKKGEEKLTQDKVEIVPANAATAALYTYTPWVGEAGGGRKGVGGASLHYQVWERFADAVGYGVVANNDSPRQERGPRGRRAGRRPEQRRQEEDEANPTPEPEADAGASPSADAGASPSADAGASEEDPHDKAARARARTTTTSSARATRRRRPTFPRRARASRARRAARAAPRISPRRPKRSSPARRGRPAAARAPAAAPATPRSSFS